MLRGLEEGRALTAAIDVERVTKRFAATVALDDVSLSVERGTVLALLGPNGAGKTTLIRILTTLLRPDSGRVTMQGLDVVRQSKEVRTLFGMAGQFATVDELLTGRENLELVGLLFHLERALYKTRAQEALERMSLLDAAHHQVKTYSGGMRRRLDLAASLIGRPPVLLLDEPTAGLDPRTRNDLWQLVKELVASGTTVLLTTQYMEEAEHLADRIVVMDTGRVVAEGTANELKDQLGGDVLVVRVHDRGDLARAASLVASLSSASPHVDADEHEITLPVKRGTESLLAAGRTLSDQGIVLDDLGVRRPSLDDVFLALTGHATDPSGARGG